MPKFSKGQSGNPKGRPIGVADRRSQLRRLLEADAETLIKKVVAQAKAGDPAALRLCMERLIAPLRSKDEPVALPRPKDGQLASFGQMVLGAVGEGQITPEEALKLLSGLGNHARVVEVSDLEARIKQLEECDAKPKDAN
jgi:hypothetical protein